MASPAADVLSTTQRIRETIEADDIERCEEYLHGLNDQFSAYDLLSSIQSDISNEIEEMIFEIKTRREIVGQDADFSPQRKQKMRNLLRRVEELFFRHSESAGDSLFDLATADDTRAKLKDGITDETAVENTNGIAERIMEIANQMERHTNKLDEMEKKHRDRMDSTEDVSDILYDK